MPPEYDAIRHYRNRGIVACVQADVSAPLWNGAAHVVLADDTVTLEKAFDDAKHRRLPVQPAIEVVQSAGSLQALVFGAACDLDGGWTDDARETLQSTVKRILTDGGEADVITDMTLHTLLDLEREYGLVGGHLFHGEFALDQLLCFRPHPSLSRYATDIAGLRLGGCGVHPAGGFTLVPGRIGRKVNALCAIAPHARADGARAFLGSFPLRIDHTWLHSGVLMAGQSTIGE